MRHLALSIQAAVTHAALIAAMKTAMSLAEVDYPISNMTGARDLGRACQERIGERNAIKECRRELDSGISSMRETQT